LLLIERAISSFWIWRL